MNRKEHADAKAKNRELADEENGNNRQPGQEDDHKPPQESDAQQDPPNKRKVEDSEASNAHAGIDQPRVKRYRIYKKGPDKIRPINEEQANDAYGICVKDLQKHTGRPPGSERGRGASASGRAPDS